MKTIINVDVPALAPAIAFYRDALGLRLDRIIDEDVAELAGAASTIYLLARPAGSPPSEFATDERQYARHWTPVHIDFVVDNVAEAATRAVRAGAVQEGASVDWHGSRCISFSDPFGHGFCLIEFAGETYSDGDTERNFEVP